MKDRVILSHSGKQHSYHVAQALDKMGYLHTFFTSSYVKNTFFQKLLIYLNDTYFSRRFLSGLNSKKVSSAWRFEFKEQLIAKFSGYNQAVLNAVQGRDQKFDKYVAAKLEKYDFDVFWGFQGSSLNSIIKANELGKTTICELSIGHLPIGQKILEEESRLNPDWKDTLDNILFNDNYFKRLQNEPKFADWIIVASEFSKKTLIMDGFKDEKIIVLPLGFSFDLMNKPIIKNRSRKLKVLYAGSVTQRKGIKYLLDAVKNLKNPDIELHIIGKIQGQSEILRRYNDFFLYSPPISQKELFDLYQNFDCLVLPTLFEGFGLVIVEALAAGLPVITTPNSIGYEIIKDDYNGYIVPIRKTGDIEESLLRLYNKTIDERYNMKLNARNSVKVFSWENYQERLKKVLEKIIT